MCRYLPSSAVNRPVGLGVYTKAMMNNRILTICAAVAAGLAGTSLAHAQQGYPAPGQGQVYVDQPYSTAPGRAAQGGYVQGGYVAQERRGPGEPDFDGLADDDAPNAAALPPPGPVLSPSDPRYGHNAPHHGMPEGHFPVVSYLAVPVISRNGSVLGGLFFGHPKPARFTSEHEDLVSAIAGQAAIALDNAKLYAEINALNGKKDKFIGFASHELKTPVTTIKGYLDIARMGKIPAGDILSKIEKQVARLQGIINDLLDISKIQAGKMDLDYEKTGLSEIIKESIESVDVHQHILETEVPPDDITVIADRQKLVQVIVNLLSNAVKYSEPHTVISIICRITGDQVEIIVLDQGIGIPAEDLPNIFNQFYRASPEKIKAKGMGLGLFISKEIMEAHSGNIWAESTPGKGSAFHIVFPVGTRKSN